MAKTLPSHKKGLQDYLLQPSERNEDLALSYFRHLYKNEFRRQSDAANADGYVEGHFVLELKGDTKHWYQGLFQGLAYERKGLRFTIVIVCAKGFLAAWSTDDIPEDLRSAVLEESGPPSSVGAKCARRFARRRQELLRTALWYQPEIGGELFLRTPQSFIDATNSFEFTLRKQRKVRQPITLKNFPHKLKEMRQFFDPDMPIKAVRAFYAMIYGPWDTHSSVTLNQRREDRATLGGIEISNLLPNRRSSFKAFVDRHIIELGDGENTDDFFSRFDAALDVVDSDFRVKHGIFFTDLSLSKFAMWLVKQKVPNLGKNYLVIDPACGSGNLVTNWRSPLELRHKVVSEIEPELLHAVEQRMKGDQWHNGKFTVVPKVSENIGLNFLDKSAGEYLSILQRYLAEKGHKADKPIAFLCNPPYRSDDDQTAASADYDVHDTIVEAVGKDAASERYCCFLAQMRLICQAAADSGMPDESILLLFTKAAWLTDRAIFQRVRSLILGSFEDIGGVLVNGKEFFDLKGTFPIAFTMWRFRGENSGLDSNRSISLTDLTHLTRAEVKNLPWGNQAHLDQKCAELLSHVQSIEVRLGANREGIRDWLGQTMLDFKRARRKSELSSKHVGGLPRNDRRVQNTKAYGESDGGVLGFMDDLTPCRTAKGESGFPWFRLNPQFMDVRKNRLFSGPPTHFGYCARSLPEAEKCFIWYALARTFASEGYPMWVDALELWKPEIDDGERLKVARYAFAIGFAENECVEAVFPSGNPIASAAEIRAVNPMSPLNPLSFWSVTIANHFRGDGKSIPDELVGKVNEVFRLWKKELKGKVELIAEFDEPYFVGPGRLTIQAGLIQIRAYAVSRDSSALIQAIDAMNLCLKRAKRDFLRLVTSKYELNYFGKESALPIPSSVLEFNPRTRFDHVVERRLALAGMLISESREDPHFGVTKFAKLFYLADVANEMELGTDYQRHAAGPLDPRALYNSEVGVLGIGKRHDYFDTLSRGAMTRFVTKRNFESLVRKATQVFGPKLGKIKELVEKLRNLTTEQAEIVATLYACWNDILIAKRLVSDTVVCEEFLKRWHPKKARFPVRRLQKALVWMRGRGIVPLGKGKPTCDRNDQDEILGHATRQRSSASTDSAV